MRTMRSRLDSVQKEFNHAAEHTAAALRQLGARPREGLHTIMEVSQTSARALLADNTDSTILLVAEKSMHGEVAHALSVMTLALLLAKRLGLPEIALRIIGMGAILHDLGIGVVVAAAPENARVCPQVLIHDRSVPRREAIIVDLTVPDGSGGEPVRIVKGLHMQDRSEDELEYLLPRRKITWFHGRH